MSLFKHEISDKRGRVEIVTKIEIAVLGGSGFSARVAQRNTGGTPTEARRTGRKLMGNPV